jgi:hypothetical protein
MAAFSHISGTSRGASFPEPWKFLVVCQAMTTAIQHIVPLAGPITDQHHFNLLASQNKAKDTAISDPTMIYQAGVLLA